MYITIIFWTMILVPMLLYQNWFSNPHRHNLFDSSYFSFELNELEIKSCIFLILTSTCHIQTGRHPPIVNSLSYYPFLDIHICLAWT
jgi:hypothetical protein